MITLILELSIPGGARPRDRNLEELKTIREIRSRNHAD
jgi:hypothetical protein